MAKTVQVGPLTLGLGVVDGQGKVTADVDMAGQLGGGQAAGIVKGKVGVHAEGDVSAQQLADLAILALEHALPGATSLLEMVKTEVDALLPKLNA